jgi:hypothetical protein
MWDWIDRRMKGGNRIIIECGEALQAAVERHRLEAKQHEMASCRMPAIILSG